MRWPWQKRTDVDVERELQSHLDLEIAEHLENGLSPDEARHAASRALGNRTRIAEDVRSAWGWVWIEQFRQDLLYALRSWARAPGFTAIAVITLALGIGATTAIFSIANSVLLHPLPYRDPDRLVVIWEQLIHDPKSPPVFDSYRDFQIWSKGGHAFEQLVPATWAVGGQIMTGAGKAREILAMPVGLDFFSMLGIQPMLGREFQRDDLEAGCHIVLSYRFWVTAFAAQRNAVGRTITLSRRSCTIVGVMPKTFAFYPDAAAMWRLITPDSEISRDPVNAHVGVFGRLRRGVSIGRAEQQIQSLYREEHRGDKDSLTRKPVIHPLAQQFAYLTEPSLRLSVLILLGAVLFVLLIACVNIANLLLGQSLQRQKELALRAALGSGRIRLFRQLLTEALLLSFAGALLGVLLAVIVVHYFQTADAVPLPPGNPVSVNGFVLAFTTLLAITTTVLFGFAPAHYALQVNLVNALRASGRSSSVRPVARLFGKALVALEVALSLILLIGAGLLIESVSRMTAMPLGFETHGIFTASIELPQWSYSTANKRSAFQQKIVTESAHLPGVQSAAFSSTVPLSGGRWGGAALALAGKSAPSPDAPRDIAQSTISADYFRTLNIQFNTGRTFDTHDGEAAPPVAIINQALSRKYFPRENPLGNRIEVGDPPTGPWLTIVGVVNDEKDRNFFHEMAWEDIPTVFRPIAQAPTSSGFLVLRAEAAQGLGHAVQNTISRIDNNVPVGDLETMDERLSKLLAYARFRAVLFGAFAALALALAAVGLYGVLSHLTAHRTQEFGLRMALGAQRSNVLNLVLKEGLLLTLLGLAIGLICGLLLTRFLVSLLYGVKTTDPFTIAAVSLLLLLISAVATSLPALRAAGVDPMIALRQE